MVYYLIGTNIIKGSRDETWREIKLNVLGSNESNAKGKDFKIEKEKYKLGNIDSLMHINDVMVKFEATLEGLLKKIERQYLDITEKESVDFQIDSKDSIFK